MRKTLQYTLIFALSFSIAHTLTVMASPSNDIVVCMALHCPSPIKEAERAVKQAKIEADKQQRKLIQVNKDALKDKKLTKAEKALIKQTERALAKAKEALKKARELERKAKANVPPVVPIPKP